MPLFARRTVINQIESQFPLPGAAQGCLHFAVAGFQSFLKFWLPVLVWMVFIFSASTGGMSFGHTSRFIAPILRWLDPGMTEETVFLLVAIIRKLAHVVEYAILGILVWRAVRRPRRHDPRPWSWRAAAIAFAVASLYAMTDEFHQSFVPSRGASPVDVLLDMTGAAAGIVAVWALGKWFKRW